MPARVTIFRARAAREATTLSRGDRIEIAQHAADEARAAAPVVTGAYREGIAVEVDGDRVFVVDNDDTAIFKEYGTSRTSAHAVLTDAVRKHGKYRGWRPRGRR